jgi:hypothetical protein
MKTLQYAGIALVALGLTLSGCGKPETQPTGTPPGKGAVQTVVDGFTGKTYVEAGLRAKEQIKVANEKEIKDRNEAMP